MCWLHARMHVHHTYTHVHTRAYAHACTCEHIRTHLRLRPYAEGGPPEPSNPAGMATSTWRPAHPEAAGVAATLFPYAAHQQQQQQLQQQQAMDMTGLGLGLGDCNRPVASAPTHLQHWCVAVGVSRASAHASVFGMGGGGRLRAAPVLREPWVQGL